MGVDDEEGNNNEFVKIELDNQNEVIKDQHPHHQQQQQQQLQQQTEQNSKSYPFIPIKYNKFFKEKIRKQYECNMGYTRFDSNVYPIEMSNYLTIQEYKSSIDQINQVFNYHRRISNCLHSILYISFTALSIVSLIYFIRGIESSFYIGFVFLFLDIIVCSLLIVFLLNIKKKAFKKLYVVIDSINQVYLDRCVRFEIIRKSYNSCKGFVYFPNFTFDFRHQYIPPLPPPVPLYSIQKKQLPPLSPPIKLNQNQSQNPITDISQPTQA